MRIAPKRPTARLDLQNDTVGFGMKSTTVFQIISNTRHEKTGGAVGSPGMVSCCRLCLERNPEAELQLPHQAVCLQASDEPAATGAINSAVGSAIDRMIEHIEEFRLELGVNPLGDGEVLENGHVRQEFSRPGEAVALHIAKHCNARIGKRAAGRDE